MRLPVASMDQLRAYYQLVNKIIIPFFFPLAPLHHLELKVDVKMPRRKNLITVSGH